MPRQRKQTVEYFPHYCDHKTTIFIVEQKYGNDGYAFWFKLLEILGKEDGHYLDLRDPMKWEFLQAKTRLDEITTCSLLDLLAKLDAIDQELWQKKIVWSENFVKGLTPVYANRRVEIPTRPTFLHVETTPEPPKLQPEIPKGSKGSKVKKIFLSDSDEIRLSELLFKNVSEIDPKAKTPNIQTWASHIDLMIRVDKRTTAEIETVINWCRQDSFWGGNIQSTAKLREKFTQLLAKMKTNNGNRAGPQPATQSRVIETIVCKGCGKPTLAINISDSGLCLDCEYGKVEATN